MTAMMPVRIQTSGPTIEELPDPPSGAAGPIKKLENRIDKQALASTPLALEDAHGLAPNSALALEDKPAADVPAQALDSTAQDLRARIMGARMTQVEERKAGVSFFPIRGGDNRPESLSRR